MTQNIDNTTEEEIHEANRRLDLVSSLSPYVIGFTGTAFLMYGAVNKDTGSVLAGLGLLYFANSRFNAHQTEETNRLLGEINDNLEYLVANEKKRESN